MKWRHHFVCECTYFMLVLIYYSLLLYLILFSLSSSSRNTISYPAKNQNVVVANEQWDGWKAPS